MPLRGPPPGIGPIGMGGPMAIGPTAGPKPVPEYVSKSLGSAAA